VEAKTGLRGRGTEGHERRGRGKGGKGRGKGDGRKGKHEAREARGGWGHGGVRLRGKIGLNGAGKPGRLALRKRRARGGHRRHGPRERERTGVDQITPRRTRK
jgi:hypothetical protein